MGPIDLDSSEITGGLGRGVATSALPSLTIVARALCLLAGEGMSFALATWALRIGDPLLPYVTGNTLPPAARQFVVGNLAGGALAGFVATALVLATKRREGVEVVRRLSRRLAPLLLSCLLPVLFDWKLWQGKDLEFLVIVALAGIGTQRLVRLALLTEPVFPLLGASPGLEQLGRRLKRATAGNVLPLGIVCLGAATYTTFFAFHTLRNHYRIGTAALDLGLENNLVWNAAHWGPLFKSSPLGGPHSSHGGYHQTYFAYVLGLPYRLAPGPPILLVIQAFFIGIAAIPLYLLAHQRLSRGVACTVALLYLLYAPLHGANLYDFHYLPISTFFLWTTLNLLEGRRYGWAVLAVLCTLSVREDVSALLSIVGVYLLVSGRRPWPGLVVAAIGGLYFVSLKLFLMPRFLAGSQAFIEMFRDLLPEGDKGYGGVLKTAIANPGFTLGTLLQRDKLVYMLQIIVPFAFFPWRRPIGFLCVVPGFLFTLLSTKYAPLIQPTFQYTTYWTVFLFIAVVANLGWLQQRELAAPVGDAHGVGGTERAEWRASRYAWLAAMVTTMLATSYQFGALLQQNTARGGFGQFRFDLKPADEKHHTDLYRLIAMVPPDAKVVSSELIVPHVSNRPNSYTLRTGMFDADYLLVWMPPRGDERSAVVDALRSGKFGVVAEQGEFMLAQRNHSTEKNTGVLTHYHL
jgi:uncharacterized membrane protein